MTLAVVPTSQPGFWALLAEAVGRFHIALLHFPVALLVVAALLEAWAWAKGRGRGELSRAAGVCLGLGAISAVVSAFTGWLLAGWPAGREEIEWHRWVGTATAVAALVAWMLRSRAARVAAPAGGRGLYLAGVVVVAGIAGFAGHLGGSITHGQGYLTEVWAELFRGGNQQQDVARRGGNGGGKGGDVQPGSGSRARAPGAADTPFTRAFAILEDHCLECHGSAKRKGGLRLDSREAILKGGKHGPALVVGDANTSYLVTRIYGEGSDERMPPGDEPLTDEQIKAIEAWINDGAQWPAGQGAQATLEEAPEERHWAYVQPVKPPMPDAGKWGRNAIDGFTLASMKQHKLAPSPESEKGVLLRRATLDLSGLPPTVEELDAFEADPAPDAYEKAVDRLLASAAFGERWARPWLDLARYGDSRGYEKDNTWVMWPYRDWVINALNADMPFDRFTVEQIAGDLLPNATEQQRIATAFERMSMLNEEGGVDPEEARVTAVVDRVDTTATVWLGATMGCARCHDHKFDPVTMKDYYALFAYFNSTAEEIKQVGDGETHVIAPTLTIAGVPGASVQVMEELQTPRSTRLMHRGNFRDCGDIIAPAIPAAINGTAEAPKRTDRLGLAEWIIDKNNPLTARVQVNRIWSTYFGRGLVETEEDFGTRGSPPSHPELLDWLAREFIEHGWSQKHIHRLIVTSATYRQSSLAAASEQGRASLEHDPANTWLARAPRQRLDAESIRDQALALAGLLSTRFGGPSVKPPQPDGIWGHAYSGEKWIESAGEDRYRRGIYTFVKRATPYPSMAVFDAPSRQVTCPRRVKSNTPLQALTTLNDPVFMEAAVGLARRTLQIHGDQTARLAWAFRACTGRTWTQQEQAVLVASLTKAADTYRQHPDDARKLTGAAALPDADVAELAAFTVAANVLLNLDEVLCKG